MQFRVERAVFLFTMFLMLGAFVAGQMSGGEITTAAAKGDDLTGSAVRKESWDFKEADTASDYWNVIEDSLGDDIIDFLIAFLSIFAVISLAAGMTFTSISGGANSAMYLFAAACALAGAYFYASIITNYLLIIIPVIFVAMTARILLAAKEGKSIGWILTVTGISLLLIGAILIGVDRLDMAWLGWVSAIIGAIVLVGGIIKFATEIRKPKAPTVPGGGGGTTPAEALEQEKKKLKDVGETEKKEGEHTKKGEKIDTELYKAVKDGNFPEARGYAEKALGLAEVNLRKEIQLQIKLEALKLSPEKDRLKQLNDIKIKLLRKVIADYMKVISQLTGVIKEKGKIGWFDRKKVLRDASISEWVSRLKPEIVNLYHLEEEIKMYTAQEIETVERAEKEVEHEKKKEEAEEEKVEEATGKIEKIIIKDSVTVLKDIRKIEEWLISTEKVAKRKEKAGEDLGEYHTFMLNEIRELNRVFSDIKKVEEAEEGSDTRKKFINDAIAYTIDALKRYEGSGFKPTGNGKLVIERLEKMRMYEYQIKGLNEKERKALKELSEEHIADMTGR